MYDLRAIRDNPAWFDAALRRRGLDSLSSQVLEMDEARRSSQTQLGELQARRNAASKEIGAAIKDRDTARADALNVLGEGGVLAGRLGHRLVHAREELEVDI